MRWRNRTHAITVRECAAELAECLLAAVRDEAQQALVRIDEIPQQEVELDLPKTAPAPTQAAEKKRVESLEIFLFETMWKSRSNWKLEDGTDARTFCHHWAKEILHFMESENSARLAAAEKLAQALSAMQAEFRGYDLPYGSKAYAQANEALAEWEAAGK